MNIVLASAISISHQNYPTRDEMISAGFHIVDDIDPSIGIYHIDITDSQHAELISRGYLEYTRGDIAIVAESA